MGNIKMIVTDLDGTLLHTDKSLSSRTVHLLHRFQQMGGIIVIATARFLIGAEDIINIVKPDYEITTDGTMIHSKGNYIYGQGYSLKITNKFIQSVFALNSAAEICTAVQKKVYWNNLHIDASDKLYKAIYNDYKLPLEEIAYKFYITSLSKESANDIGQKCESKVITYRDENCFGFIPTNSGKVHMIKWLSQKLNISMNDIVAFGDDQNDIEMLKACGIGVAVGNAIPMVKSIADDITLSNDNDGVYEWLISHLIRV